MTAITLRDALYTVLIVKTSLSCAITPEQLQETNHSKFAGAMSSKVIMGSNCPALVTYHPYNLESQDII